MNIAWIGTGVMGAPMAKHIRLGGHTLRAYNRSKEKAEKLIGEGIEVANTVKDCVANADVIFTIVGFPSDIDQVYRQEGGIFEHAKKGAIIVDMTTSSPKLAQSLYAEGKKKGLQIMDAPVSGGDIGARNATLSIMTGGDWEAFLTVKPLFELMGKNIFYMGPAGSGQHTKAANQIAVAGAVAAMTEAVVYAQKCGMDGETVLNAISGGAAGSWQINHNGKKAIEDDFAPGFFIKHFIKDMNIAKEEMKDREQSLPMLDCILGLYEKLMAEGFGDDGTQALIRYYKEQNDKA